MGLRSEGPVPTRAEFSPSVDDAADITAENVLRARDAWRTHTLRIYARLVDAFPYTPRATGEA